MDLFREGDYVYYPDKGTSLFKLKFSGNGIKVQWGTSRNHLAYFTDEGMSSRISTHPSIFHATKKNHELLEKLHGVRFESPPRNVLNYVLDSIAAGTLLRTEYLVGDSNEDILSPDSTRVIRYITSVDLTSKERYRIGNGGYQYVIPLEPRTNRPITELI